MSDGTTLHTVVSEPENTPIGHIHIVHGMAEHIGRYEIVLEDLANEGYLVTGHNQRGHGEQAYEKGELGDFADGVTFDRLVEDVHEVLLYYKDQYPSLRRVLFGHSMGSFVARRFSQTYSEEIDALICSGTAGKPGITRLGGSLLSSALSLKDGAHAKSHVLDSIGFGGYNKIIDSPKTKFDWLSTDRQTVQEYIDDPLSGAVSTNRFFHVLFDGLKVISQTNSYQSVRHDLPVLFLSGTDDPVGNMGNGVFEAANMYVASGVKSVTVHLFEGVRHEALQEPSRDTVLRVLKQWVAKG